jgi:SAM-dependent methyltransferase
VTRFEVGDAGRTVDIDPGWRVLDVGSGQAPHPRADVLLEKYVEDDWHRAGGTVDCRDPRLVVGDAAAMPFADREFDYVIASHIAEHVDDPVGLCRELARVGAAGYLETPATSRLRDGWATCSSGNRFTSGV